MTGRTNPTELLEAMKAFNQPEAPEPWDDPIPLDTAGTLPAFPVEALPGWLAEFVKALAVSTQTPPDMGAMLGLSVLAACAGRYVMVEVRPDWTEPTNLWTVVTGSPATRKSAVFAEMTRPLLDYERELIHEARPIILAAETKRKIADGVAAQQTTNAIRAKRTDRDVQSAEAIDDATEAHDIVVPAWPRLWVDDVTPEAVGIELADQGERLALFSAEGGPLGMMAGRYEGKQNAIGPNLDVWLKAHSGDSTRVKRVGRSSVELDRPALTIGLAVQPAVLKSLFRAPDFKGRGLLGRFLYSTPPTMVGNRVVIPPPPPIPGAVRDDYRGEMPILARTLRDLPEPLKVTCGPEASDEHLRFSAVNEPRLDESSGDMGHMSEWGGKLPGAIARIAALFHLAEHLHDGRMAEPIGGDAMRRAIKLAPYLVAHAMAAHDLMGADGGLGHARFLLSWIIDRRKTEWLPPKFSAADIRKAITATRFPKTADVTASLVDLAEFGWVRRLPPVERISGQRGASLKERWELHPKALGTEQSEKSEQRPRALVSSDYSDCSEGVPANDPSPAQTSSDCSDCSAGSGANGYRSSPEPPPVDDSWIDAHHGIEHSEDEGADPPPAAIPAKAQAALPSPPVAALALCPGCGALAFLQGTYCQTCNNARAA